MEFTEQGTDYTGYSNSASKSVLMEGTVTLVELFFLNHGTHHDRDVAVAPEETKDA